MEHVDVLRDLSEVCRAAIKAGDWKVDGACDPDAALRRADAAIAYLSASQSGEWVLVPREPTEAMLSAAHYELADKPFSNNAERSARAYAAMLAAAPQPPAEAQPVAWAVSAPGLPDALFSGYGAEGTAKKYAGYGEGRVARPLVYGNAPPPSAPVGVEELVERMRQAPDRLWMADLVGQKISVERMRDILTFALAQQPAACPRCDGTGEADSGGIHPWGAPAMIRCECQQPAAVDGVLAGWSLRHDGELIRVIGPDGRSYAGVDPDLAAQQGGEK